MEDRSKLASEMSINSINRASSKNW
uniref:Uncharacterized protein n=1 Tax=Tetranychus urticae TaxID=32264 RepID=A0A158P4A5_TETUR